MADILSRALWVFPFKSGDGPKYGAGLLLKKLKDGYQEQAKTQLHHDCDTLTLGKTKSRRNKMTEMSLILIGTDHRLQQSIVQVVNRDGKSIWVPRSGGERYRKLIAHCIEKLGAKAILEETHPNQDQIAPTLASRIAKKRGLLWQALGLGEPGLSDALSDPPLIEAIRLQIKPYLLAGVYRTDLHAIREQFMYTTIMDLLKKHGCVLAVVGYVHLGVLARMFEAESIPVTALLFTYPFVIDEARS
jgi:hypothetical protein